MISPVHSGSSIIDHEQIKFGEIVACINDKPAIKVISRHKSLMDIYLRQADLEDNNTPDFLCLGAFKCPIKVLYPRLPQSFLASTFKYAPSHSSWPPILAARHKADLAQACYSQEDIDTLSIKRGWLNKVYQCKMD